MRILKRPFINTLSSHIVDYPTPVNISYLWGFGSTAGIFLSIQLITGIALAMHYVPHIDMAFFKCRAYYAGC